MKIIDKRGTKQEETEYNEPIKKVEKKDETIIEVLPDWRISGELRIMKEDHERWGNGTPVGRTAFLQAVIENRDTLDAIELLDYDSTNAKHLAGQDKLVHQVDQKTLDTLKAEARALSINLDTYMRALTYSYAKKLRDAKAERDRKAEETRVANTPLHINLPLPKRLQSALFAKYPLTEEQEQSLAEHSFMIQAYIKERLLQLIEDAAAE